MPAQFSHHTRFPTTALAALLCTAAGISLTAAAQPLIAQDPAASPAPAVVPATTTQPPGSSIAFTRLPPATARLQLLDWLQKHNIPADRAAAAAQLWPDNPSIAELSAEETLDRLVEAFAAADDSVAQLVKTCQAGQVPTAPDFSGPRSDPFCRSHLQLWLARWFVQHRCHDEALPLLESLTPEQLADPASLFFYRAASRLQLLQPGPAGNDLTLLLNNTPDIPPRFRAVAEMMQAEVRTALNSRDGLPQVARLMSDVQRRLDLGKADQPVQKRETEVIDALDKLLKELEEQQQQQQQQQQQNGQGGGGQNMQNAQPREQGGTQGIRGDGRADRRELSENGAWGMLDKQQEVQARELIRQQFPPNFLDAISRYTQKLAEQKK
jgi:hypothetical protein